MKTKLIKLAFAIALSATLAGSAAAELVAGWDFSGGVADGVAVSVATAADVTGAGASGSITSVSGDVVLAALPPGTSLKDDAGIQGGIDGASLMLGDPGFNGAGSEFLGLTARSAASIAFDTAPASPMSSWRLTFGGRAIPNPSNPGSNGVTVVDVSFGSTCGATAPIGSVALGDSDEGYSFFLSGASSFSTGCVVFDVDGTNDQPLIDNVAVTALTVPEPGILALLASGVLGLAGLARTRRA